MIESKEQQLARRLGQPLIGKKLVPFDPWALKYNPEYVIPTLKEGEEYVDRISPESVNRLLERYFQKYPDKRPRLAVASL